jgi:flagellar basal body P-ring protein FlgI
LAGGQIHLPDTQAPTRGIIRQGATLEQNFFYAFIEGEYITLVLDDQHAGWPWAHMTARAINHELVNPMAQQYQDAGEAGQRVAITPPAEALGPKNIRVRIPVYELNNPANYISRVLQTPYFMLPQEVAKVTVNRATQQVAITGNVTVSPTVLQIPGLGTVFIGKKSSEEGAEPAQPGPVPFTELLETLSAIQITPGQLINAVEQLHQTGTLHAKLVYE